MYVKRKKIFLNVGTISYSKVLRNIIINILYEEIERPLKRGTTSSFEIL